MKSKAVIMPNRQASESGPTEKANPWPVTLQVPFTRSIVWTFLITTEGFLIWDLLYPGTRAYFDLSPVGNELFSLFVKAANLAFVFVVLAKLGKFDIGKMILFQRPAVHIFAKWIFIGLCLTLYNLPFYFPLGIGAQHIDFVVKYGVAIFYYSIFSPIKEEFLFRGLFYGAIRTTYGKWSALFFSVIAFVLVHSEVWELIGHGHWGLLGLKVSFLIIVSVVLAHLYESTHSLLLCMGFHGAVNVMHNIAPLLGYMYNGYLIDFTADV